MERIRYELLKSIKKDPATKTKPAKDSDEAMLQFFYSKKNLFYLVRDTMTLFELGLWVKSMTNYVHRKNRTNIHYDPNKREIVLIDYGINVGDDVSYEHPGIVIAKKYNSVLVIPCSTGKLKNAFTPNGDIMSGYLIGETTDGFSKQTAVVLYNAKWISKHSIINNRGDKVTKVFFDKVIEEFQKITLTENHKKNENQKYIIEKLDRKIVLLNDIIKQKNQALIDKDIELNERTNV